MVDKKEVLAEDSLFEDEEVDLDALCEGLDSFS